MRSKSLRSSTLQAQRATAFLLNPLGCWSMDSCCAGSDEATVAKHTIPLLIRGLHAKAEIPRRASMQNSCPVSAPGRKVVAMLPNSSKPTCGEASKPRFL